ncbi:MAG: hypothetical protein R6U63_07980 [Longimicrobiales bacterium]
MIQKAIFGLISDAMAVAPSLTMSPRDAEAILARNFRLTGEVQYDLDRESYRVATGFVSAF